MGRAATAAVAAVGLAVLASAVALALAAPANPFAPAEPKPHEPGPRSPLEPARPSQPAEPAEAAPPGQSPESGNAAPPAEPAESAEPAQPEAPGAPGSGVREPALDAKAYARLPEPAAGADAFAEPPAEVRAIRGRLTPPDRALEVHLVERMLGVTAPVKVDRTTGAFEAKNLRMGTYCFIIRTPWGRLEGVDLTPRLSPYDALIPPTYRTAEIGLPPAGAFAEEDRAAIRRIVRDVKRYENKVTDLAVSATPQTACVLVELLMDAPFHGRKGDEITWRIEKWYYDKLYDAWTTFRTQCLYRLRASKAEWETWGWQFEPKLGGLDVTFGMQGPIEIAYEIPAKPTREKGLAGSAYPPADKARTW